MLPHFLIIGPSLIQELKKCIFLGYPFGVKGYRVLDLSTKTMFTSRDVVFHENHFPYVQGNTDFNDPFVTFDIGSHSPTDNNLDSFVTLVSISEVHIPSHTSNVIGLPPHTSNIPLTYLHLSMILTALHPFSITLFCLIHILQRLLLFHLLFLYLLLHFHTPENPPGPIKHLPTCKSMLVIQLQQLLIRVALQLQKFLIQVALMIWLIFLAIHTLTLPISLIS